MPELVITVYVLIIHLPLKSMLFSPELVNINDSGIKTTPVNSMTICLDQGELRNIFPERSLTIKKKN